MRYWQPKLRSIRAGEWLLFDDSRRIAVIREVHVSSPPRPLLRAETWAPDEDARVFLGYFPVDALRLAAETVWWEYRAAAELPKAAESTRAPEPPRVPPGSGDGSARHPLLNAQEHTPGVWTLVDSTGREYGAVRIVREGAAVVYVGELRGERLGGRNVKLREAVEKVHAAYVRSFNATPVRARPDAGRTR
ncbi:hypothetical protein [Agromyces humatus]|uniref:HIRAN domain-containing protein n=1 Tax=Agromyces humatus TaxID=279573 RepID=A0ABP4X3W2_9MICO|nr:hypothetical protein [Agromyces humatus]